MLDGLLLLLLRFVECAIVLANDARRRAAETPECIVRVIAGCCWKATAATANDRLQWPVAALVLLVVMLKVDCTGDGL